MAEVDYIDEDEAAQETLSKWGVTSLEPSGLYTFSSDPKLVVHDAPMPTGKLIMKPSGLWYTDGSVDSWLHWCVGEQCKRFLKRYLYRLELDYTNMLRLQTPAQIFEFTEKYGTHELGWEFTRMIAWDVLWEDYSGLEIIPYQWACRLEPKTHWYYGWDCSSGCIWDAEAVKRVELIGENTEIKDE